MNMINNRSTNLFEGVCNITTISNKLKKEKQINENMCTWKEIQVRWRSGRASDFKLRGPVFNPNRGHINFL